MRPDSVFHYLAATILYIDTSFYLRLYEYTVNSLQQH